MRAARFDEFGGPDVVRLVTLPAPHAGPGEVRVRVHAAGVNASDAQKRRGLMDPELPQTLGYEAAGVVDEVGEGVSDTRIGDRVVGGSPYGQAQAELAVLAFWAPVPEGVGWAEAAAIPVAAETAARGLDELGVGPGTVLVVNGASGNVGLAAVQFAVARGAQVIGTASPASFPLVEAAGATPVAYGPGLVGRVRAIEPGAVGAALDVAGHGALADLVALTGSPDRVVTLADLEGARATGVRFSRGDAGRATYAVADAVSRLAQGMWLLPPVHAYPLEDVARAHRDLDDGAVRGKIVLTA